MKGFIRKRLREQIIDGENMSKVTQTICDKMSINSYQEAVSLVKASLKQFDETTKSKIMTIIATPLENLRHEQNKIDGEVKSSHMSGDSVPDEADTYWHQIQSTICEMGPDFQ